MISALIDDIGDIAAGLGVDNTHGIMPPMFQAGPMSRYRQDIGGFVVDRRDIGDPPGWFDSLMHTGLEAYRVREGRRAMANRPLTPDEASLFTRSRNTQSLAAGGTTAMVIGGAIILLLMLRK